MKHILTLTAAMTLILFAGCSKIAGEHGLFHNRAQEYKQAESIAPMKIPEGNSTKNLSVYYPIPEVTQTADANAPVDLYPPSAKTGR